MAVRDHAPPAKKCCKAAQPEGPRDPMIGDIFASAPLDENIERSRLRARDWLFEFAAPLWSSRGVLDDGMFAEKLGQDGSPRTELPRRIRVQARQIYSFCAIGRMGWSGPWRQITNVALDNILSRGIVEGSAIHLFSPQGAVVDRSQDLYDHAFVLFALAHAGEALERRDALDAAEALLERMAAWRRPEGGFWEGQLTPCPPYRQNPHMHLFEAAICHAKFGHGDHWQRLADEIRQLFANFLFDRDSGAVTEYFDHSWNKAPGTPGHVVEPGHCFEWSWLLRHSYDDEISAAMADSLAGFAFQYGICSKRDVAINEVDLHGSSCDAAARLWPQCERLKAALSIYARRRLPSDAQEVVRAFAGLERFFDTPTKGTWWDRLTSDDTFIQEDAPASSFYHIVCALVELDRICRAPSQGR